MPSGSAAFPGGTEMKRLTILALLAAQVVTATQPALAADLTDTSAQRIGAFAGLRVRVPLDSARDTRAVRAGLTLAPTLQSQSRSGEMRTRFGEGLELGITGDQPVRLAFAGTPLSRLAQGPAGPVGDAGPQGPEGPQGPAGPQGTA